MQFGRLQTLPTGLSHACTCMSKFLRQAGNKKKTEGRVFSLLSVN